MHNITNNKNIEYYAMQRKSNLVEFYQSLDNVFNETSNNQHDADQSIDNSINKQNIQPVYDKNLYQFDNPTLDIVNQTDTSFIDNLETIDMSTFVKQLLNDTYIQPYDNASVITNNQFIDANPSNPAMIPFNQSATPLSSTQTSKEAEEQLVHVYSELTLYITSLSTNEKQRLRMFLLKLSELGISKINTIFAAHEVISQHLSEFKRANDTQAFQQLCLSYFVKYKSSEGNPKSQDESQYTEQNVNNNNRNIDADNQNVGAAPSSALPLINANPQQQKEKPKRQFYDQYPLSAYKPIYSQKTPSQNDTENNTNNSTSHNPPDASAQNSASVSKKRKAEQPRGLLQKKLSN